jgi:site-specific DNA-methyltransferase (cytosine-N4-specific)
VLDPYVGSGTTLLEAQLAGREACGFDLSPLAVLIARTKTTPVPAKELMDLCNRFESLVDAMVTARNSSRPRITMPPTLKRYLADPEDDPRFPDPWFSKWFQPHVLAELIIIHRMIESLGSERRRNVAMVAFSNILRRCSNAHSGYPNVMFDRDHQPKPHPAELFYRSLIRCVELVGTLDGCIEQAPPIAVADATDLPLAQATVDAVITHPPYIGSVPYAEYGLLSLKWLGADPKMLDRRLTGGRRQSRDVVERFRNGYSSMLAECWRVLRPSGRLFLLVGNPLVRGEQIDLAEMSRDLAAGCGFDLVELAERKGANRRANKMGIETLLFFERPA